MRHFYEEISEERETKSTLCSIDLEKKLVKKFEDKLKFMKSSQCSTSSTSELEMSADESALPDYPSTVLLEGGIEKSLLFKNCGKVVNAGIQDRLKKNSMASNTTGHTTREKH